MLIDSPPLTTSQISLTGVGVQAAPTADTLSRRRPVDSAEAFQHLARGVAVVTSSDASGERFGITSTDVCALSADPPTLVVCVDRNDRLGRELPRTQQFCVNLLTDRQDHVADAFSGPRGSHKDRFSRGHWEPDEAGCPALVDALASFTCEVDLLYAYPQRLIVVGRVRHASLGSGTQPPLVQMPESAAARRTGLLAG